MESSNLLPSLQEILGRLHKSSAHLPLSSQGSHVSPINVTKNSRLDDLWRFYERNKQGMYAYALSITRCESLAEDCIHDAIMSVASNDRKVWNLKPYVFRAVRNEALRRVRVRKREQESDSELLVSDESNPYMAFLETEEALLLAHCLDSLDPQKREIIVLKIYGELKFREIAKTLNRPLPTVASQYRRGLIQLAEILEEYGYEA